jgi:hypothetical protein
MASQRHKIIWNRVALVGEESVSGGPRRRARQLSSTPNWSATLPACLWGNWEGPHVHDVAMEIILPALYQANVSALGLEFANPRRQHEVAALRKCKLPDRMVLIPGVIDPKSISSNIPRWLRNASRP